MKPSGQGVQTISTMGITTRDKIVRDYELPPEIIEFVKKNGPLTSYNSWYSENGTLKIK